MAAVVIISKDRDFSEVVSELVSHELGMECHVAEDEKQAAKWPDAVRITSASRPVRMSELLEKAAKAKTDETLKFGAWEISTRSKTLSRSGQSASLTDKELSLLKYLSAAVGSVAKDELLRNVWGFEANVDTHTLETHIYRLRGKCRELGDETLIVASDNGYGLKP